jgi:hypothetical protein
MYIYSTRWYKDSVKLHKTTVPRVCKVQKDPVDRLDLRETEETREHPVPRGIQEEEVQLDHLDQKVVFCKV